MESEVCIGQCTIFPQLSTLIAVHPVVPFTLKTGRNTRRRSPKGLGIKKGL